MSEQAARPKLLFVYLQPTSFVRDDLALLSERYDVQPFHFDANRFRSRVGKLWGMLFFWLKQAAWLVRERPGARIVFGWFADYHMVLPVLVARRTGIPAVVVIGGSDANALPELNYGVFNSAWQAPLARYVLRHASLLVPNVKALIYSEDRYATWPEPRTNGLLAHVPDLKTPREVVPVGFDPDRWPLGPDERPPVVGCVAYLRTPREIKIKGIDVLVAAAALVPEATFRIVGATPEMAHVIREQHVVSGNVEIVNPVPRQELPEVYAGLSVYAQLSRIEGGLPNVVCEAMLCGCVPVVSRVGNMPATVGDTGVVVDAPEPEAVAGAIRTALAVGPAMRKRARQHVVEHYSMDLRRRRLLAHLDGVQASYLTAAPRATSR